MTGVLPLSTFWLDLYAVLVLIQDLHLESVKLVLTLSKL